MTRECVSHHYACDCREALHAAEVARLITNENLSTLQHNKMLAKYELAESRLAEADALLHNMRDGAFNIGGWADSIDEYFQSTTDTTEPT